MRIAWAYSSVPGCEAGIVEEEVELLSEFFPSWSCRDPKPCNTKGVSSVPGGTGIKEQRR